MCNHSDCSCVGCDHKTCKCSNIRKDLIPNKETLDAIEELNSGKGKTFNTVEELFKDLES